MKSRDQLLRFLLIFFLSIATLFSFYYLFQQNPDRTSSQITVSAATSLSDVMIAIQPLYLKQYPDIKLIYNFGSSGSLQQQIEQGAPVDLFISADIKQMDILEQKGLLLPETRKNILTNSMVLVVPKGKQSISSLADLNNNNIRKIAIGEPNTVPAGKYAKEILTSLNLWDSLQSKIVYAKNARQVLSYVETGNVDAGIVYQTNAKISEKIDIIATIPATYHSPIIYPIAIVKDSKNIEVAKQFITFISGNSTKFVFEKYGFQVIQ
ncbi:MAG: molybdate ABC transporter substrate-binding protein [Microcoleaceae cyanobacterium]